MIRNSLIALLTLAVIGLSWMTFSGPEERQGVVAEVRQKIVELKRHVHEACDTASQETGAEIEHASVEEAPATKGQEKKTGNAKILRDSDIERNQKSIDPEPVKPARHRCAQASAGGAPGSEQSAAEILNEVKKKPANNDHWLTGKELESVLSLLKSAQSLLRKTSFIFPDRPTDTPPKNTHPDSTAIKKKLSDGPEELG